MAEKQQWPRDLWLDAIWEDDTLKPNERLVAYCYARYAGKTDSAFCSWAEIQRRTGIRSREPIWTALGKLKANGWLKEIDPPRQHRSAVYRLTVPLARSSESERLDASRDASRDGLADTHRSSGVDPAVRNSDASSSESCDQQFGIPTPSTQIESSEENSDLRPRGGASLRSPPATKSTRASEAIREATARRQQATARCIVVEAAGIDEETVDDFVRWLAANRPKTRDMVALLRHLAESNAIAPLLEEYYTDMDA